MPKNQPYVPAMGARAVPNKEAGKIEGSLIDQGAVSK